MITYKNTSLAVKTFYGVEFRPGDVREVPGFILDPAMIRYNGTPKEPPKAEHVVKSLNKSAPIRKNERKQSNESNKTDNKEENPNGKNND